MAVMFLLGKLRLHIQGSSQLHLVSVPCRWILCSCGKKDGLKGLHSTDFDLSDSHRAWGRRQKDLDASGVILREGELDAEKC